MPGLQMRRDVGRAQLECFERHARHDAGALDAAARRDGVIAIDRAQQRRFARAIRAVHHPAIAGGHFQIDAVQDVRVVDVHVRAPQRHQHAAALALAHARGARRRKERMRFLPQQLACAPPARIAPLRFTRPCSSSSRCVIESGTSPRRCVAKTQGIDESRGARQPVQQARVIARIEAVRDFVEQQQLRPARERARDQHQAALAI